jgi:hypothetical protein
MQERATGTQMTGVIPPTHTGSTREIALTGS